MDGLFDLPGIDNSIVIRLFHIHSPCAVNHGIPGTGVGHNNRRCEIIQSGVNVTWDRSIWASRHQGIMAVTAWIILSFLCYIGMLTTFLIPSTPLASTIMSPHTNNTNIQNCHHCYTHTCCIVVVVYPLP